MRVASIVSFMLVMVVLVGIGVMGVVAVAAQDTPMTREALERRVWELERQLAVYQNAEGLIVVRYDGQCAQDWWDAGEHLDCGTAWGRFRIPISEGITFTVERGVPHE